MKKIILLVSFLFIAFIGYSQDTTTYYKLKTLEINKVEVFKLNDNFEYDFCCDLKEDEIEALKTVLLYNVCNYMRKGVYLSCPHFPVIQFKISNFTIQISRCDEMWSVYENGKLILYEKYCRPEDIEAFIKSL